MKREKEEGKTEKVWWERERVEVEGGSHKLLKACGNERNELSKIKMTRDQKDREIKARVTNEKGIRQKRIPLRGTMTNHQIYTNLLFALPIIPHTTIKPTPPRR